MCQGWWNKYMYNKKVLLRERKRHTARRVAIASPCYSGGGVPWQNFFSQSEHVSSQIRCQKFFPLLRRGTPGPETGYPPHLDLGPPTLTWTWDPPTWTWTWDPPPRTWTWDPPPCGQTHRQVSKHYLPVVLRTRAVKTIMGLFSVPHQQRHIVWTRVISDIDLHDKVADSQWILFSLLSELDSCIIMYYACQEFSLANPRNKHWTYRRWSRWKINFKARTSVRFVITTRSNQSIWTSFQFYGKLVHHH